MAPAPNVITGHDLKKQPRHGNSANRRDGGLGFCDPLSEPSQTFDDHELGFGRAFPAAAGFLILG